MNFHNRHTQIQRRLLLRAPRAHAPPNHPHPPEVTTAQSSKSKTVLCGSGLSHSTLCLRDFSTLCAVDHFSLLHNIPHYIYSFCCWHDFESAFVAHGDIRMMKCLAFFLQSCFRIINNMEGQVHSICNLPLCMPAAHTTYSQMSNKYQIGKYTKNHSKETDR